MLIELWGENLPFFPAPLSLSFNFPPAAGYLEPLEVNSVSGEEVEFRLGPNKFLWISPSVGLAIYCESWKNDFLTIYQGT